MMYLKFRYFRLFRMFGYVLLVYFLILRMVLKWFLLLGVVSMKLLVLVEKCCLLIGRYLGIGVGSIGIGLLMWLSR